MLNATTIRDTIICQLRSRNTCIAQAHARVDGSAVYPSSSVVLAGDELHEAEVIANNIMMLVIGEIEQRVTDALKESHESVARALDRVFTNPAQLGHIDPPGDAIPHPVEIEHCTSCGEPTHPSMSDDNGRCAQCSNEANDKPAHSFVPDGVPQ